MRIVGNVQIHCMAKCSFLMLEKVVAPATAVLYWVNFCFRLHAREAVRDEERGGSGRGHQK